jgi:3-phytase
MPVLEPRAPLGHSPKRPAKPYRLFVRLGVLLALAILPAVGILSAGAVGDQSTTLYLPIINGEPGSPPPPPPPPGGPVVATAETDPVPSSGDAADDPAIWIHPTDPSLSLVIGTDKDSGLGVYDLSGNELQFLADGQLNNVDLRYGFPVGDQLVDLVTAGDRASDTVAVYRIDPQNRALESVDSFPVGIGIYGSCMYRSPLDGQHYVFVTSEGGEVEQWQVSDNGAGGIEANLVRAFDVGSQSEGCVADDETRYLYIAEEAEGIWKYGAEPGAGSARSLVDSTGPGGHLEADVEGLAIYYASGGEGYLLASSQGSDEFIVYDRQGDNPYVMTFEIVSGNGIDQVTGTDGIEVSSAPLGLLFPQGLFVAQDTNNDDGNQNFKLVPWETIAYSVTPPLLIDTSYDPRN